MCWVYLNSLGTYTITAKQANGVNSYVIFSIGYTSNSGGGFTSGTAGRVYYKSQNSATAAVSATSLTINTWYHIAISCSTTSCLMYINGALSSTTNGNYTIPNNTSPTNSLIGLWYADGAVIASYFNGRIDDFSFWNTNLSGTDIQTIYNFQV